MALILFGMFIALLAVGVPVGFSICSAAGITLFAGLGDAKMMMLAQRMFVSCDSFSLIAVPFFIFAGDLLAGGKGISLGKMAHRAGFDCNMEAFFAGGVNGMRFGLFGETEVEGPALAGVSKGVYWGLFGMKVTAGGVEAVRLAGNLEAEFALVSGCPVAEGCSGWILGV